MSYLFFNIDGWKYIYTLPNNNNENGSAELNKDFFSFSEKEDIISESIFIFFLKKGKNLRVTPKYVSKEKNKNKNTYIISYVCYPIIHHSMVDRIYFSFDTISCKLLIFPPAMPFCLLFNSLGFFINFVLSGLFPKSIEDYNF